MYLRAAICEDDPRSLKIIEEKIHAAFAALNVYMDTDCFCGAEELLAREQSVRYHVFFLDIDMPGTDGITLGKQLHADSRYAQSPIIFISGRSELVYQSLQAGPFRFIRKSTLDEELPEAAGAVIDFLHADSIAQLCVESEGRTFTIPMRNIEYVECFRKDIVIHHNGGEQLTARMKFSDIAARLEPFGFLQTHKSYLVNYRFVYSIEAACVRLDSGLEIPLSRQRTADFKRQYMTLISENGYLETVYRDSGAL